MPYSLDARAELYNSTWGKRYPGSHLRVDNGIMSGMWILGNNYRNKSRYFGAYPPQLLPRTEVLFPDLKNILHLFSGSLPKGRYVRFDMIKRAEVNGNAEQLSDYFPLPEFNLNYSDPPYHRAAATIYGTPMPNRLKVMNQLYEVMQPGGFVVWLDTVWPMVRKTKLKLVGLIGIARSQNHVMRGWFIHQKPLR